MYNVDKKLLDEFANERNLSSKTKQSYINALNCYMDFNNESFSYLLSEAEEEENNMVRWKNRKLKHYLLNFRSYLQTKYLASTAKLYFQRILTLYTHFEIEVYKLPSLSTKSSNMSKPITFEDLPTKKIIRDAFNISNPIMKAIILFISSSGCARRETLNLTIRDFISATSEYHNEKNIKGVISSLNSINDIVPVFRIKRQKTNKYYFTFCSPEASKYIIKYLSTRKFLKEEDMLFDINLYYFNKYFNDINNELKLGKIGPYNRFRSHMLRKFHASSLYNSNNNLSLDEIDALQGRSKDSTHASYFMENPTKLRKKYIESLNSITFLK